MRRFARTSLLLVLLSTLLASSARAQFFGRCSDGSDGELDRAIEAHETHMWRLYYKFVTGYYHQGKISDEFEPATRADVARYLERLEPSRAAVLFYGYAERSERFCTWMIQAGKTVSHVTDLPRNKLDDVQPAVFGALGVRAAALDVDEGGEARATSLAHAAELLLPQPVLSRILSDRIDRLIVVPIFAIGSVPFAALPVGDGQLVDHASITIAPGFFGFKDPPPAPQRDFSKAVVLGDPASDLSPLPGARTEAQRIAKLLGVTPLVGAAATREALFAAIGPDTALIHIAAHGTADSSDPRDASMLHLSDGPLPAAHVDSLEKRLGGAEPLVVLSACQTGLGKDFDVGTIGMARAWQRAGAPNVLMSLWNVDDEATRDLITGFIALARTHPPDLALRRAMLAVREKHDDPRLWASFGVFGRLESP